MTFEIVYEVKFNAVDLYADRYAFVKRTSSDKMFVEYAVLYIHKELTKNNIKKTVIYEFCPYTSVKSNAKDQFYYVLKIENIDVKDKEYMDKVISEC